ncbi:MAG: type pilus assembly protein PilB [Clostridiales bacterium]|jgi:type IV pilus assembly protein PilB|nr:type pilus assembly protein PilB [Clostridiales bacterium]MDN5282276.1 type pilus assembly protein PilB [Candidatus Ozemobacter sp.]
MAADFLKRKRIGEILIEMRAIQPEQLERALKRQPSVRKMIGEILIEDGALNEETLYRGLSIQHGIEYVNLDNTELNLELIRQIPESLIKTYKFIPLRKEPKSLTIAVFDPTNTKMFDSIKMATGFMFIKWVLSSKSQIIHIISDVLYRPQNVLENVPIDDLLNEVKLEFSKDDGLFQDSFQGINQTDFNLEELKRESDQTSIVTLVHKVILDAVKMRASDIHIEAFEKIIQVRYRIDGILYDIMPIERAAHQAIISRIKIMANLDITERFMPQDGSFKLRIKNQQIEFRVAILPSIYGQNCTIRVLDSGRVNLDLGALGFEQDDMRLFEYNIGRPWGLCLLAGPTGSGKTTTLYSALSLVNSRQKKVITVEDPVEFKIPGVHQMQVHENKNDPSRSLTFARGLRAILRLDPDIILVGEIRDYETAEITVKAALTGHMVFSTIHANTAIETVSRLENLGIDPYLYASALCMLVGQRLVRKICPHCKTEVEVTPYVAASLGVELDVLKESKLYRGMGCKHCNNSGFRDRTGLYEVIEVGHDLKELIGQRRPVTDLIAYLRNKKVKTLSDCCRAKVLAGEVPVEEYIMINMGS